MGTTVRRLISLASQEMGSDTRVAARLGVTRQRLWEWKTGARPMPLERVAHLASLIGWSEEETIAAVAIDRHRSGKTFAAIALIASAIAASSGIYNDANANPLDTRCITRTRIGRFLATLQSRIAMAAPCWV